MSLHNEIMALACRDIGPQAIAYKIGHKEARHAAAELAIKADAEIERLEKQVAAYSTLTKSQEAQLSHLRAKADEYRVAVATLDSERAANERLTAERDAAVLA